ncbi:MULTISPECIES: cold-shock protein [unclassified Halomonas]|uniref:cold-shock protein n=1 Tax=unclassified Halomonas TaxID=2609666 RepID=UPI0023B7C1EC|nr:MULTISPECIES: cold shock domain-containing protein [unclassified Halomonas]
MNRKVILRCSLVSLLFAVPAPLLIALFVMLFGGAVADMLAGVGMVQVYIATVLAVFLLLLAATLAMHMLSPRLATIADVENDDREIGEVKWFNVNKGYGFITRDDGGEDVFVHFRAIRGKGHRTLAEGQKVRYYVVENERGLQADDVTVIT